MATMKNHPVFKPSTQSWRPVTIFTKMSISMECTRWVTNAYQTRSSSLSTSAHRYRCEFSSIRRVSYQTSTMTKKLKGNQSWTQCNSIRAARPTSCIASKRAKSKMKRIISSLAKLSTLSTLNWARRLSNQARGPTTWLKTRTANTSSEVAIWKWAWISRS